jgi:lysophospholipase L1-like esterase
MKPLRLVMIVCVVAGLLGSVGCASAPKEKKISFVYMALGASDATGVGAIPLTEGYVYLIKAELDKRIPGVALVNLGVPGARIDLIKEQVRVAAQTGVKANLVTLWTGANDLVHGDDPRVFQQDLHFLLTTLKDKISTAIAVANLPDMTQLPRFRREPSRNVTIERIRAFNQAIEQESRAANARLVNLFAEPVEDDLVFDLDGFHPNNAGHRRIAQLFLAVILPMLHLR